ncbi:unnamed protein product [Knipowitschia caucasica]|uniref:EGF-like domain-containing protein n=1 Tax=Knipowitschia caucasica TaxID=637954 RepID=A0AAV2IR57_KNICA
MAKVYTLYVGVLAGLVLYSEAGWNTTQEPSANVTECHHQSNGGNCTDQWTGHFLSCPEQLTYYCIHGECRYIKEMDLASCRCHYGFYGSRCEFLDFDAHKMGKREIIIVVCAVVGLVLLIVLVVFICLFTFRKGRRREERRNGNKLDVNSTLIAVSTEEPHKDDSV